MAAARGFRTIACWLIGLLLSLAMILPLTADRGPRPGF
jgi:hypothetical protein